MKPIDTIKPNPGDSRIISSVPILATARYRGTAPMIERRSILVTGAAGRIGRYLRAGLPQLGFDLRLLDRVAIAGVASVVADICDADALASAMNGISAVVHLAGAVEPSDSFDTVLSANIAGTYCVMEAARAAGVLRFVFASSNHANGLAPRSAPTTPGCGDRPDSYYGVSKLFGETLSRLYSDRYGMQIACLRIGSCLDRPVDARMLGTWLSPMDVVRLVAACLTAPTLDYAIVYGISRNQRRWWDLAPAAALGYEPMDDAEVYADEILAPFAGKDPSGPDDPQGGAIAATH
jgi:uronate dehydrogenase